MVDWARRTPDRTVTANILDPMGGMSLGDPSDFLDAVMGPVETHQVENWTIGEQVSQAEYDKFVDPESQELYVLTTYEHGNPSRHLVIRAFWEKAKEIMDSV